ncbi:hypothetical protein NE237_014701 [Protea cynaroides]|uniref:Sn1-specific diacylglycerol lipase alpha n=1 Tax=Protea cynaroides TaxID=273540 RepID=A0A9Q0KCM7_9MAGN|nr:hypothetical protein NE237_014701 [Protea cynaroides]
MAMGTVASAAGAAMLLFYLINQRWSPKDGEDELSRDLSKLNSSGRKRIERRHVQAPATWFESITTASETLRFAYSETLGKWPIADLTLGINYLMRRQDPVQVASVYAGSDCIQLKGPEIRAELTHHLRLMNLCMLFSKKSFSVFLEYAGCSKEDVLLQETKAGLLKPAFTIINDRSSKCFLLLIRGMHSIKDTLTAATGAVVPFHHSVLHEDGGSNLVLGYAHCGMVAAARWIAKHSTPCLLKALAEWPDYNVKIVGNSLGAGIASLLTYILRECKEFSSATCIAFAPAACMTWDLAESGKHCITTVINGSDLVPACSPASVDDLRSEVMASSWLSDLRDQLENTRFLDVVFRSATALGSRLPYIAIARENVADAGALLQPVSSSTQVVIKPAQNVAQAAVTTCSSLSSWSCMGARRRTVGQSSNSEEEGDAPESLLISKRTSESFVNKGIMRDPKVDELECCSRAESGLDETEEEEELIPVDCVISTSKVEDMTEGELWYELKNELHGQEIEGNVQAREEVAAAKETTEEEKVLIDAVDNTRSTSSNASETHRFYPPGRIMHIVARPLSDAIISGVGSARNHVGIYETPRDLYSKIRLSKNMIHDHYMPICKKMMELLLSELEKDEETGTSSV